MSGLIPREFINELINRTDIVELINARVSLKKAGRNYQACCPFHTEKSPSFTVNPAKQFYHCFGCGVSGNVIGFLMAYDRLEFVDAIEILAKQLGLEIPTEENAKNKSRVPIKDLYTPLEKTSQRYQQALRQSDKAKQYLIHRGLTGEIAKTYHIGYAPQDGYDKFQGRIIFPIRDKRGRVMGFGGRVLDNNTQSAKYLNSADSPIFHKSNILYGLYEARQANRELKKLIVVEGYMDVVSLANAGITEVVATLGTATTTQHIQQLFQQAPKIIFCFDGDNAGRKAAWRALESALSVLRDDVEVQFLFLPEGEDPDSLIKKEGKEAFLTRLESAQSLSGFFFGHLKTQINMYTVEGRSHLVDLALPYIEKISAPIFKEMMLDQLSVLVRFEKSQLYQYVNQTSQSTILAKIQRTPMRLAIALLLQNPELITQIKISTEALVLPGSELFNKIMILLQENPALTTGNLLEYFREKSESELVHKLSAWNHGVPEEGIAAEFQDIINHLQKLQRNKMIEKLIQKANQNSLNELERVELQNLLSGK